MARILVIDDDPQIRTSIRRVLEREGHEVLEAEDGRQAIALVGRQTCDLVITDINMPEMDGIEVIMALAENRPGLPVIAVSGGGKLPKELLLSSAGVLGAVTTLGKPFDIAELVAAVRGALAPSGPSGDSTDA